MENHTDSLLKGGEAEYRALLDAMPDPVVVYDTDGNTIYVNEAFIRVYGWSREDLLGSRIDFVPEAERLTTQAAWARTLRRT